MENSRKPIEIDAHLLNQFDLLKAIAPARDCSLRVFNSFQMSSDFENFGVFKNEPVLMLTRQKKKIWRLHVESSDVVDMCINRRANSCLLQPAVMKWAQHPGWYASWRKSNEKIKCPRFRNMRRIWGSVHALAAVSARALPFSLNAEFANAVDEPMAVHESATARFPHTSPH